MTADPKEHGAPSPTPDRPESALGPRWRTAGRVLTLCGVPVGLAASLGWLFTASFGWFAPAFAVASARAAVEVLGQRFDGPRRAGEVRLGASLMALLLSLSLSNRPLSQDAGAALAQVEVFAACVCVWVLSLMVGAFLSWRELQAEWREWQRANEGSAPIPTLEGRPEHKAQPVRRVVLGTAFAAAAYLGVSAWAWARQGHPSFAAVFLGGGLLSLLLGLFAVWWFRRSPPGPGPGP